MPDGVYDRFAETLGKRGQAARNDWYAKFEAYRKQFPAEAKQIDQMQARELPEGWDKDLPTFPQMRKGVASRDSSGKVLNALAKNVPWLIGGAADLAPSTKTLLTFPGAGDFEAHSYGGRNFHFGIREHAMAAVINGMSLTRVRSVWCRLSHLQRLRPALIAALRHHGDPHHPCSSHIDSIGVGEDGPTHQPIEQLMSLLAQFPVSS